MQSLEERFDSLKKRLKKVVKRRGWVFFVLLFLSIIFFLFIFVPTLNLFLVDPISVTLEKLSDPQVRSAISVSLLTGTLTTLLALVFCVPLAYLLARNEFMGKSLIESIVDLPILIPHSVAGMIILSAFGPRGILRVFFNFPRDFFIGEIAGIVVAQLFVSAPFMVKLAREGFEAIDPKLEHVARTLGASPSKVLFTVSLPLAARAIFGGAILTWARAISEFGAVLFIAYTPYTIPTLILYRFNGWGLNDSRPIAVLFLFICLWIFIVLRFIHKNPLRRLIYARK